MIKGLRRQSIGTLRFVVNADDLGMSNVVNAAIEASLAKKLITSASIMANGPAFNAAVAITQRYPKASFGVHLNASEYEPLTRADLSPLVSGGEFANNFRNVALGPRLVRALIEEFDAQILRIKTAGVKISHLDSHHHIHTVPQLLLPIIRLARKHNIAIVRPTRNLFRSTESPAIDLRVKKFLWNAALYEAGLKKVDFFCSLEDFVHSNLAFTSNCVFEIMVHPGSQLGDDEEAALLPRKWWTGICDKAVFESFNSLADRTPRRNPGISFETG